jgi:hypothetical protein
MLYRLNITFKCLYEKPMPDANVHRGLIFVDGKRVRVVVTMMSEDTVYTYLRGKAHFGPASEWTYYCDGDIRGLRFTSSDWGQVIKATPILMEVPA